MMAVPLSHLRRDGGILAERFVPCFEFGAESKQRTEETHTKFEIARRMFPFGSAICCFVFWFAGPKTVTGSSVHSILVSSVHSILGSFVHSLFFWAHMA